MPPARPYRSGNPRPLGRVDRAERIVAVLRLDRRDWRPGHNPTGIGRGVGEECPYGPIVIILAQAGMAPDIGEDDAYRLMRRLGWSLRWQKSLNCSK